MAQAQVYMREISGLMELITALYEQVYTLDGSVHRFGRGLRQIEDQVPPNFRIEYRPEADGGGILLNSL